MPEAKSNIRWFLPKSEAAKLLMVVQQVATWKASHSVGDNAETGLWALADGRFAEESTALEWVSDWLVPNRSRRSPS